MVEGEEKMNLYHCQRKQFHPRFELRSLHPFPEAITVTLPSSTVPLVIATTTKKIVTIVLTVCDLCNERNWQIHLGNCRKTTWRSMKLLNSRCKISPWWYWCVYLGRSEEIWLVFNSHLPAVIGRHFVFFLLACENGRIMWKWSLSTGLQVLSILNFIVTFKTWEGSLTLVSYCHFIYILFQGLLRETVKLFVVSAIRQ